MRIAAAWGVRSAYSSPRRFIFSTSVVRLMRSSSAARRTALVNTASILDTDSLGDVAYVGGELYSDAVLIQSDILAGPSDDDPDALVYEAIAFLTTDDCGNVFEADDGITLVPADSQSVDVLSSVLT